jgi:hypothetical protein
MKQQLEPSSPPASDTSSSCSPSLVSSTRRHDAALLFGFDDFLSSWDVIFWTALLLKVCYQLEHIGVVFIVFLPPPHHHHRLCFTFASSLLREFHAQE